MDQKENIFEKYVRELQGIPFYDERYVYTRKGSTENCSVIGNPVKIRDYLQKHVYKQDEYCKDAAMILFDHMNVITSRNIVCGPAGCGKTYVWECLKEIFPRIIMVNSAVLTKDGWTGNNKTSSFLDQVDFRKQDYIIVFDEFDKCVCPHYSGHGENVSASIQSEFLKMVEGDIISVKKPNNVEVIYDTSKMTFVFCGSFAQKAGQIAENNSSKGLGFGSERKTAKAFERELTIQDLIEFGLITELASRCTRITNIHPLELKDYVYLITSHPGSPVKKMEKKYRRPIEISYEECCEIAKNAYDSGLGIRNTLSQIQRLMDAAIFESFLDGADKVEHTGAGVPKSCGDGITNRCW